MKITLKCHICSEEIEDEDDLYVYDHGEYFHWKHYAEYVEEQLFRLRDLDR